MRSICQRLIDRANQLGGPDNITVIAARFDGDALRAASHGDSFGYNTFPLAGTLNEETRAIPQEEFEHARSAKDHARLGAPEPVVEARRRAAQPVFLLLGVIALLAVIWFLFALFG